MPYTAVERFIARQRFRIVLPFIGKDSRVCDFGAGMETGFLRGVRSRIKFGVGVDMVKPDALPDLFPFVRGDISAGIPLRGGEFHHVVMLAVLEHISKAEIVLREAHRVLMPGGSLIITYPSAAVDPIVKVLDWLGSVSPESGFHQHQPRIPASGLVELLREVGFEKVLHRRFQMGLNNLFVAYKPGADRAPVTAGSARG